MINKFSPKSEFFKNILTLVSGTTLSLALPVLASPLLTRFFSPEELGLLALYIAIVSLFVVIASGRYEQAILLPENKSAAFNLTALASLIAIMVSIFLVIVIFLFRPFFYRLIDNPDFNIWLNFVPISVLLLSLFQVFTYWAQRFKNFKIMASSKVSQALFTTALHVILGYISFGAMGLLVGLVVGQLISFVYLIYHLKLKSEFALVNKQECLAVSKRYRDFPLVNSWSALLNAGSIQLPILLLGSLFNASVVGLYSLGHRVLSLPLLLIGRAVGQVFFQQASTIKSNLQELGSLSIKIYQRLLMSGALGMSLITFYGDFMFSFIFGREWEVAGIYAQYMTPWFLFVFATSPISFLFTVLEKQKQLLSFNLAIFFSRLVTLFLAAIWFENPLVAIAAFATVSMLFWLVQSCYILSLVHISPLTTLKISFSAIGLVYIPMYLLSLPIRNFINAAY